MKKVILMTFVFSLLASVVFGDWEYNPFTGELDYHSGVSAPGNYEASPTLTNLRDFLITVGLMEAAPVIPPAVVDIEQFFSRTQETFFDRANEAFFDR